MIWIEEVGVEERMCGLLGFISWKWYGCNEVRWIERECIGCVF